MEIIDCSVADFMLYQVQNGETLNEISNKFSNHKIIRNNPAIDTYEGEVIKIVRQNRKTHIVKPMENLGSIASKYNTTIEKLVELNNLNSKRLFVGQTIIIDNYNQ